MRRKILFLNHAKGIGGASINLLNIIETLDRDQFDVKVLLLFDSDAKTIFQKKNIPFQVVNSKFINTFYKYFCHTETGYLRYYRVFSIIRVFISWVVVAFFLGKSIIKKENPDLVYLNSSVLTDWAYASKKSGYQVVCHIQETLTNKYFGLRLRFIKCIMRKYTDHIICISKYNASILGLKDKCHVVYNFVDFDFFNPDCFEIDINDNYDYFLYVGGYSFIKGFPVVAKCLDYIPDNVKIFFLGHYPDLNDLSFKKRIKRILPVFNREILALEKIFNSKKAIFIGISLEIPLYIAKSKAVLFPATKSHFARPVIEAQAMKKPAIVSDLPGMSEIIQDGINGLLVKPNDSIALANAMKNIVDEPLLSKKMGENGYVIAKDKYTPQNTQIIIEIIQNVIKIN